MSADWTIAFDDLMTTRFRVCPWCSPPATHLELWASASGEAMAVAGCRRCGEADAGGVRRTALVERQVQQRGA